MTAAPFMVRDYHPDLRQAVDEARRMHVLGQEAGAIIHLVATAIVMDAHDIPDPRRRPFRPESLKACHD